MPSKDFPYTFPFYFADYTKPVIQVRVAFGSDPFDITPTWTDISSDIIAFKTRRGRQHELDRIESGTATIILDNSSGNYWNLNAGGSYYPNVLPGKRVNIGADFQGTRYDLYTGFVESWAPSWLSRGGKVPIVSLNCADLLANLSRCLINSAGYAQEVSGDRVKNVLDDLGWVELCGWDIDAGQTTLQRTDALVNENALSHLHLLETTEQGIVFQAPNGDMVFQDRYKRLKTPYTESQATFGDDSGEMEYTGLEPSFDATYIYNDVRIAREGGDEQTASDATSQSTFGRRSLARDGLLMTTDAVASDQANYLLSQYKDPALRAQGQEIMPEANFTNLFPKVLSYDISTRITLRLNQASIDKDYYIEEIAHTYDARKKSSGWKTNWELSDAKVVEYWALSVSGFSELGDTTRLGF